MKNNLKLSALYFKLLSIIHSAETCYDILIKKIKYLNWLARNRYFKIF